jgi:hypothetical protein
MARRTFADFNTELLLALGKRTDFTATMRGFAINAAYTYVANVIRHPELETSATLSLTLATDSVALPSDFWFPELVKNDTDSSVLYPASIPITERQDKPDGNPTKYTRWGSTLVFDLKPLETKSILLWYTKNPAELSGVMTSVLDVLYDQLILLYSIKFAFEELRDYEQAAKVMIAANVYSGQIKAPWRMTKTEDGHKSVRVRMR